MIPIFFLKYELKALPARLTPNLLNSYALPVEVLGIFLASGSCLKSTLGWMLILPSSLTF